MTILNLPDLLNLHKRKNDNDNDNDDDKDKRKNDKPKNSANDTSLLVYITPAAYARRSTTGAQTPLGKRGYGFPLFRKFFHP
jgi:hypothetical protein